MEGVSVNIYGGIKQYWSRRGYRRIYGTGRRRINRAELGKDGTRKKRSWRIKITRKLRFSPKKFFVGLRDAYVNFMLRIANSRSINSGFGVPIDAGAYSGGFGKRPLKEYDEKMLVEIYKTLIAAQGQLVVPPPHAAGRIANQIACGR